MILQTPRLILRPWREDDAETLFKYASDDRVGPVTGWHPHKNVEESREALKNILMKNMQPVYKDLSLSHQSVGQRKKQTLIDHLVHSYQYPKNSPSFPRIPQ